MEAMGAEVFKALLASGPMAAVLAYALSKVWSAYQTELDERKKLEAKLLDILSNAVNEDHDE